MNELDRTMLARVDERTEAITRRLDELCKSIELHEKAIFRGNGRPSILSRVDKLEANSRGRVAIAVAIITAASSLALGVLSRIGV